MAPSPTSRRRRASARTSGKGMGLAFADYDADGWPDVFVSNDAWRNFLFRNRGDGTFEETALYAGVAYVDAGRPVSGMGADFRDYDGDGRPDIFMSALSNETFPLFRNEGNGMFREETYASRLGGQSLAWGGWSTGMVDLDNDGFLDLFVAGGHVQTNEELYSSRSSRQSNRVFRNLGDGTFRDVTRECGADFQQVGLHRGAAFGDLDDDGRVDAVVTRLNEPVEVFVNRTEPAGHYLLVRLVGTRSNRDGLGARPAPHARLGTIARPARDRRRRIRRLQRQAGALRPGRRGPHPEAGDRHGRAAFTRCWRTWASTACWRSARALRPCHPEELRSSAATRDPPADPSGPGRRASLGMDSAPLPPGRGVLAEPLDLLGGFGLHSQLPVDADEEPARLPQVGRQGDGALRLGLRFGRTAHVVEDRAFQ